MKAGNAAGAKGPYESICDWKWERIGDCREASHIRKVQDPWKTLYLRAKESSRFHQQHHRRGRARRSGNAAVERRGSVCGR